MKAKLTADGKFIHIYDYEQQEIEQIRYSFKKRISNWRYHPLVKKKLWNGEFSFIDSKYNLIPIGLYNQLENTAKKFGFEFELEEQESIFDNEIIYEEFEAWVREFFSDHPDHKIGGSKEVRDYQIKSAFNILKARMSCSEIATSAGKTLIMFIIFAYLFSKGIIKNYMIVVPTTSLILQGIEDFNDYNNGKLKFKILGIQAGSKKDKTEYEVIIGTFQSLVKREAEWFSDIDVAVVDECLHPDSMVTMADGTMKRIDEVQIGEFVKTIDESKMIIEDREVEYVYKNLSKEEQMYEIELEDGKILKLTGNHKVLLKDGTYKRIDILNEGDDISIID